MLRDMTIKKKLMSLVMVAGTSAVLIASIVFYLMIMSHLKKTYADDLTGLARVLARNCEAPLAFRLSEEAERVLASLVVRPSVIYAVVLDRNGNVFSAYKKNATGKNLNLPVADSHNYLKISQEIVVGGTATGSLVLFDDRSGMNSTKVAAAWMLLTAILISLCGAFIVVSRMQRLIAGPILELSSAVEKISREQDFSLRAEKFGSDEVGQLVDGFNAMLSQIQERNAELVASEQRFSSLVDQAVDAFFLFDMGGRILDVNKRACDGLGYAREELLAMSIRDIEVLSETGSSFETLLVTLMPHMPITIEDQLRCKKGQNIPVEMRIGLLEIGGRRLVMGLARDISDRLAADTEKQKLEFQLQQAQKMEAIGTLAGGIAHDFNNILTAIIGFTEFAKVKLAGENPSLQAISSDLDRALGASYRAADLVKQILAFSRQTGSEMATIEMPVLIKEVIKLLRASIPSSIEIRQHIDPRCGSLLANPTQIHQILMNLCTNAYYAMREKGGILSISLEGTEIGAMDAAGMGNVLPGRYLKLSVSDTGHGMDRATMERIFDPYFTTKPVGEGTGMGLSVVHGIIKSYHGHISVYSEPGQGTAFNIYLPEAYTGATQQQSVNKAVVGGSERLLIVDDENEVIQIEEEMLTHLGYTVLSCSSPQEALEKFSGAPDTFDLVITDMTMPLMSGTELVHKLLAIRPDTPIILCTGFSDRVNEETAQSFGIKKFLMKPMRLSDLAETVRAVLDNRT